MEYKIVEFNEATAQITIHVEGFSLFSVDLPLDENQNAPVGEELELYLKGFIPTWHLERQEKLSKGVANALEIAKLVTSLPVIEPPLADLAVRIRIERDERLLKSDWTQLPDVNLTAIEKELWLDYRQALRDVTKQDGFPVSVVYPLSPEEEPR
jgi:hypothetical protein